jgi:hypothetical protein
MAFSRLVAVEGFTQRDAYIEIYKPETNNTASIDVMASRIANKQRVRDEIERIKQEEREGVINREERLRFALDGQSVITRMAIDLYSMATCAETTNLIKLKAWQMLGSMKHVDAFVSSGTEAPKSKSFGIRDDQDATAAKETFLNNIKSLIGTRIKSSTIEIMPQTDDD